MKIFLIGFGDIARRLASRLVADGCDVSALRRTAMGESGIRTFRGDCRDEALLAEVLAGQEAVVVTLAPDAFTEQSYRDTYEAGARALARVLTAASAPPRQVLWVSSTSVYGESDGGWVHEATPARPQGFSGRSLLAAEDIIRRQPVPAVVVRFSGIYGPGRTRLVDQVRGGHCAPPRPPQWSNRIHSEDCAGVLHHLIRRQRAGKQLAPLYLGTDCEPVPLHEVHQWLAQRLGVAVVENPDVAMRANRRCSNTLLLASGYRFIYPTWREGYADLLGCRS
ncbi:MAG: NAD(P)H-binding protein [Bacteroidales bacterium]|nr:NAD(P)H-binding protein [Bacteroidales bacterium]